MCENCCRYFNCRWALLSDFEKAHIGFYSTRISTPLRAVIKPTGYAIGCTKYQPDGGE